MDFAIFLVKRTARLALKIAVLLLAVLFHLSKKETKINFFI
jgi:hypothetical protein